MGYISTGEHPYSRIDSYMHGLLIETLKEILREIDNKLTEEDLDGIIEEVDEDGSGTLDFDG